MSDAERQELRNSPVTPWMAEAWRDVWAEIDYRDVAYSEAMMRHDSRWPIRLGDGTPERKEDDGPHANRH